MKLYKNMLGAAFSLGVAIAPGLANAQFGDFVVDEGSVPDTSPNTFTADKVNGSYLEQLTINADSTFSAVGYATFSAFLSNEGSLVVPSQINNLEPAGYLLRASFESTGSFDPVAGTFTGGEATFNLFADPNQDSDITFGATAADAFSISNTGDNYGIGFATNAITLEGIPGVPGAFNFIWDDFTLTADGQNYFISPDPFYVQLQANGDFDVDNFGPGTFEVTGDVSAVFDVTPPVPAPEPASMAMLGLGLLGFRATRRRAVRA